MEENLPRKYFALVQLDANSDLQRLANDIPAIIDVFSQASGGDMEQVCRSSDGLLFGFFLKVSKPLDFVRAEFQKSTSSRSGDSLLIFEVNDDFTGQGFTRAWTWLQNH
ncbi:MAG: hypothetical protein JKY31_04280 [Rhodobacteraceae bacterium]|nr:hypothetical protein [Paracoccaceae bacterium]